MEKEREVVCGADIHKQFLLATILTKCGQKFQDRFDTNFEGLLNFRQWLLDHRCQRLAVESTANYWLPIYLAVRKDIEFVLANAYQIKHIPGRKTDVLDSEWIAELCLKDLIAPSRIFSEEDRDLRAMTRTRESYVKTRSQIKNRIHQELESACIKLSSVLSDIFGKSGIHIIRGILNTYFALCSTSPISSSVRLYSSADLPVNLPIRGLDAWRGESISLSRTSIDHIRSKMKL